MVNHSKQMLQGVLPGGRMGKTLTHIFLFMIIDVMMTWTETWERVIL